MREELPKTLKQRREKKGVRERLNTLGKGVNLRAEVVELARNVAQWARKRKGKEAAKTVESPSSSTPIPTTHPAIPSTKFTPKKDRAIPSTHFEPVDTPQVEPFSNEPENFEERREKTKFARKVVRDHRQRLKGLSVQPGREKNLKKFLGTFQANKTRYERVAKAVGIPAILVACIHKRESEMNFNTYLHNGKALGSKITMHQGKKSEYSVHFNPGDWEKAAIHALGGDIADLSGRPSLKYFQKIRRQFGIHRGTKSLPKMMAFAEAYYGFGFRNKGLNSNYVYEWTNEQPYAGYNEKSKFKSKRKPTRLGVAALLAHAKQQGEIGMKPLRRRKRKEIPPKSKPKARAQSKPKKVREGKPANKLTEADQAKLKRYPRRERENDPRTKVKRKTFQKWETGSGSLIPKSQLENLWSANRVLKYPVSEEAKAIIQEVKSNEAVVDFSYDIVYQRKGTKKITYKKPSPDKMECYKVLKKRGELKSSAMKAFKLAHKLAEQHGVHLAIASDYRDPHKDGKGNGKWKAKRGRSWHNSAGTADVKLVDDQGNRLDMYGSEMLSRYALHVKYRKMTSSQIAKLNPKKRRECEAYLRNKTEYSRLRKKAQYNELLLSIMNQAGFVNYSVENWHFEIGSEYWYKIMEEKGYLKKEQTFYDTIYVRHQLGHESPHNHVHEEDMAA